MDLYVALRPSVPPLCTVYRSACICGAVLGGLKCLPQACTPTGSVSPSHLSGCQIFATRSVTELEAVIAPGHLVLSLCVLSNCHGNRVMQLDTFCSNWEGMFTITVYNIIGPSSPLSFPSLSPPSQPERPTRWCHKVGWVLLPWQLICRWVQADDTTVSPRLPPSPSHLPSLSLCLLLHHLPLLSLRPSLPPLSCLVLFYLSTSPFPSLLSHFYVSHMINVG